MCGKYQSMTVFFQKNVRHSYLGIFAYVNYHTQRDRKYILETLVNGLKRLEYRGYDSAGAICKKFLVYFYLYSKKLGSGSFAIRHLQFGQFL